MYRLASSGLMTPRTQKITCAGGQNRRHRSRSRGPVRPSTGVRSWNRMSNRDGLLAYEDFFDQEPENVLALPDLQAISPRAKSFAELESVRTQVSETKQRKVWADDHTGKLPIRPVFDLLVFATNR